MTKNEKGSESMRIYEVGYLLVSSIPEERLAEEVGKLRDAVVRHEGAVIAEEGPKMRELAYPMDRMVAHKKETFRSAYFGWIKFEMPSDNAPLLKKALEENESVVRFLLILTVRENTMASRRTFRGVGDAARRRPSVGPKMSDEEIEKTIEALVADK